jgi:hypothetical protein
MFAPKRRARKCFANFNLGIVIGESGAALDFARAAQVLDKPVEARGPKPEAILKIRH